MGRGLDVERRSQHAHGSGGGAGELQAHPRAVGTLSGRGDLRLTDATVNHDRTAGSASTAANSDVSSPLMANTPNENRAWFSTSNSEPQPITVVAEHSASAPPVFETPSSMLSPSDSKRRSMLIE